MAELTIQHVETFETIECYRCGITFAMTDFFITKRRRDHESFFCPNGHSQHFPGKSDVEKEREKNLRLQQELDQSRAHQRTLEGQIRAAKGQATKLRKRIGAGVCPCCHRTFKQLGAHMANKHPDFASAEPDEKAG